MLNKNNIFFNITSNSYSQFLNCSYGPANREPAIQPNHLETAISMHYKTAYMQRKKQNWTQMIIFNGLGLVFACLALLIFWKSPNFNCGIIFNKCEAVKNSVDFLCLALSIAAFGIGCTIRPEKEALNFLANKVQHELSNPACQAQIELNSLFQNVAQRQESAVLIDS